MISPVPDRRKYARLEGNVPVKLSCDDFDVVTETRNLSCAGAFCHVDKPFDLMTKLQINLLLPLKKGNKTVTKKIVCQGVVVRVEPEANGEANVAIFFSDIHSKDAKAISDFVNTQITRKASPQSSS